MTKNLPAPVEGASDIAKFGIGISAAIAALINPWLGAVAGVGQVALGLAIDRYREKPQAILEAELRAGNLGVLTDEQLAAFVPMAFRFFEAARQGEYEHNLEVLAAYITGELKKEIPDAGAVARMARRIEALSIDELKLIAVLSGLTDRPMGHFATDPGYEGFSATNLFEEFGEQLGYPHPTPLLECLSELASRSILVVNGTSGLDKNEDFFLPTQAFYELVEQAHSKLRPCATTP